jgi:hypothetical protein
MTHDPAQLGHPGEFAALRNFLMGTYYQTVWEDFSTDEDIWQSFLEDEVPENVHRVIQQLHLMSAEPPEAIHDFFIKTIGAGGLYFSTPSETVEWLDRCLRFLEERANKDDRASS